MIVTTVVVTFATFKLPLIPQDVLCFEITHPLIKTVNTKPIFSRLFALHTKGHISSHYLSSNGFPN